MTRRGSPRTASRPLLSLTLVATLALGVTSCAAGPGSEQPTAGGLLTIGLDAEVRDLDPIDGDLGQQSTLILANAVYEPLFVDGARGALEPRLAESLTTDDGIEWVLRLRPGITFSDGNPLNAEAVVAHIERIRETESSLAVAVAEVAGIDATEELIVTIRLAEANAAFDRYFSRNLGMIASTTATDDYGNPLGAGAFVVSAIEPGVSITLVRSENYYAEPAFLDQITFSMLPDADSRHLSLISGNLDLAWAQTPNHLSSARADGYTVSVANATTATAIFNLERAPFDDLRVRQAVQAAIDRDVLAALVDQGEGTVAAGPLASTSRYGRSAEYPAYDPELAQQLLADYGAPVSLRYTIDPSPQALQRATAIQQMLGEVGIGVEIDAADTATWGARLFEGDFDLIEFVTSAYGDSDTVWALYRSDSFSNFGGYVRPELDDVLDQAIGTVDDDERGELYLTAAQLVVDDAATLFFTESPAGFVSSSAVGGMPDVSDRSVISILPGQLWVSR